MIIRQVHQLLIICMLRSKIFLHEFLDVSTLRSYKDIKRAFHQDALISIICVFVYAHKEAFSNSKYDREAIPESFSLNCLNNGFILKDVVVKRMRYFVIL